MKTKAEISLTRKLYYENNKVKIAENHKKYYDEHKEEIAINRKDRDKEYYEENKKEIIEYQINYQKEKKKNDPLFKLRHNFSSRMNSLLKNMNCTKDNLKFYDYIGCTKHELKKYIEKQFNEFMNWNNHGNDYSDYNKTWEYDHIIPISIANTKEQIIILNNYINFRPFCSLSNLQKNNRIDYELINENQNLVNYLINNREQLEDILDFNNIKYKCQI